ncbi:MAG: hypothetical protein P1V97_21475 [Planctomycetota bacterium]|nr:hypothetical protein [Planctomycetota bacterium]
MGETAEAWLSAQLHAIPRQFQPTPQSFKEFARLFAALFETSYELGPSLQKVGCCEFCEYLSSIPKLKLRKVTKHTKKQSQRLIEDSLIDLHSSLGLGYPEMAIVDSLLANPNSRRTVHIYTYGLGLLNRARTGRGNPALLVIWRHLAWSDGRLIKDFKLRADDIIGAEKWLKEQFLKTTELPEEQLPNKRHGPAAQKVNPPP